MFKTILLAAATTLVVAGSAAAQDARSAGRMDQDGDRRISLAEMQARHDERFTRLDVDRDGRLTREERQAGRSVARAQRPGKGVGKGAERRAAAFARRDANRDGGLSQAEAPKRFAPHFARLDADRDGRLTQTEVQAGRALVRAERGPRGARAERAPRAGGDGVLTRAETAARVQMRFARLDVNRDGFLTRDERRSGREQRRG